jgi:hypothetical protein
VKVFCQTSRIRTIAIVSGLAALAVVLRCEPAIAQTVTVSTPDPNAAEQGQDPGRFTITRTGLTTGMLIVNCSISGTATPGTDYTLSPSCPVTIPAGSASVNVTVTPVDDALVEGPETVILTLEAGSGYTRGSPSSGTVTIADHTVVTAAAPDPNASEEDRAPGTFIITRSGATTQPLLVNCSISGTATPIVDYTLSPSCPVTIAAGSASATVTVTPLDDTLIEGSETVILTIMDSPLYAVGNRTAIVTILDNDYPAVSVTATDPNAAEQGRRPGTFSITRTGPITSALIVSCTIGGTATSGNDYTISPSCPVTIPPNSSSIAVTVTPIDDSLVEGDETVTLTITAGTGYTVGTPNIATVTIMDNDSPAVTVAATDPNAAEQGRDPGTFSITRTGPTNSPLTVNCTVSGTATAETDYTISPSCPVTIPGGSASLVVTVTPVDDNAVEGDETVILALTPGSGYTVTPPGQATITIADNDTVNATVSVSASDPNAAEQGQDPGAFSILRSGPATSPLVVNCTVGGTATSGSDYALSLPCPVTIPAGAASVTVTVTPIDDVFFEGDESVTLTLTAGTGYSIGSAGSATVTIVDNEPLTLSLASGSGFPATLSPSGNPPIRFVLSIPAVVVPPATNLTGRLDASFTPDPLGVEDPNMRFQNGLKSVNISIPAGSRQPIFVDAEGTPFAGPPSGSVGFQPGTNAGTITFTLIVGSSSTTLVTRVDRLQPAISRITVQRTSDGMSVSVTGFSTTRDMTAATFAFTGSGGAPPAISPPAVAEAFAAYFARRDDAALKSGSLFVLTVPFIITNGRPDQFDSVKVTLTNSAGTTEMTTAY